MEDVVSFCDRTIKETNIKIDPTEGILKQQLRKNEYGKIQKTIYSNEVSTEKILHQQKLKNFNNLKYQPKTQIRAIIIEKNENTEKHIRRNIEKKPKLFHETELNDQPRKQY